MNLQDFGAPLPELISRIQLKSITNTSNRALFSGTSPNKVRFCCGVHEPMEVYMITKILSASLITIALATSAMAQSNGSNTNGTSTGTTAGTAGANGTMGTGTTPSTTPVDPNATSSTMKSNGMNDRCKDAAGNDVDNNTPTGMTTPNMQNCNK
ncbi:hypothetical protein [Mesorhizobium sp. M0488]|uniref:hypothetical protein n=1 Tax=unclassified Mesorhizobium TaxID=325217 RepID=UPI003339D9D1